MTTTNTPWMTDEQKKAIWDRYSHYMRDNGITLRDKFMSLNSFFKAIDYFAPIIADLTDKVDAKERQEWEYSYQTLYDVSERMRDEHNKVVMDKLKMCHEFTSIASENATLKAEVERLHEAIEEKHGGFVGRMARHNAELRAEVERLKGEKDTLAESEVTQEVKAEITRLKEELKESKLATLDKATKYLKLKAEKDTLAKGFAGWVCKEAYFFVQSVEDKKLVCWWLHRDYKSHDEKLTTSELLEEYKKTL
jgi:hypothetical protein